MVQTEGLLDATAEPTRTLQVVPYDAALNYGTAATVVVTVVSVNTQNDVSGWTFTTPADGSTVTLPDNTPVVISGTRGLNPSRKEVILEVWSMDDNDAEMPFATIVLDDGIGPDNPGGTWSAAVSLPEGTYVAELQWDGIVHPMWDDPWSILFTIEREFGDPTP